MHQTNSTKVLHLSYFGDRGGSGGAVSMRRLHYGLKKSGIDSKVLCIETSESDNDFIRLDLPRYENKMNKYLKKFSVWPGITGLDGVLPSIIKKNDAFNKADIISIHRFLGLTSYLGFPYLTKGKPTVLILCDTWAITGRCYNNLDCQRWKYGCGACPHRNVFPTTRFDCSHVEWLLKRSAYNHSNLTLVSKSSWMSEMLKESVLKRFPVYQIPNGIDIQIYKPVDKRACRSALQIPTEKKVLMFGAVDLNNYIKGGDLLIKALNSLPRSLKTQIVLLIMGRNAGGISDISGIEAINLGYVEKASVQALAYSSADLFLCPSRGEVFPNVCLESMSCGTPVVAFNVGGITDLVRQNDTGYLATPWNPEEFSRGIVELLEDDSSRERMSDRCRKVITNGFSAELQVDRYLKLYKQLLS